LPGKAQGQRQRSAFAASDQALARLEYIIAENSEAKLSCFRSKNVEKRGLEASF
jgi:hypothetical protein